jgi:hypothetical protein
MSNISSAYEEEWLDRLTPLQHLQTLLHGLLRFDAEGGIVIVGNRMGNHDKRIPWHAACFSPTLCLLDLAD